MHLAHRVLMISLAAMTFAACDDDDAAVAPSEWETALRAGVIMGSCVPDDGVQRVVAGVMYGSRLFKNVLDADPIVACLANASGGCGSFERCGGFAFSVDPACAFGCVGNRLTACDDEWKYELTCPSGTTCDAENRTCAPTGAVACDVETFVERCDGTKPIGCEGGFEQPYDDCGRAGLGCVVDSGYAYCVGTGASCDINDYSPYVEGRTGTCVDGATLAACVGAKRSTIKCADVADGFTCQTTGDVSFCGLGNVCNPLDQTLEPTCSGTSVVLCHAGEEVPFDCVSAGFTGCAIGVDGGLCVPSPLAP